VGGHLNLKGSKFGVLSGPKKKFAALAPAPSPFPALYRHPRRNERVRACGRARICMRKVPYDSSDYTLARPPLESTRVPETLFDAERSPSPHSHSPPSTSTMNSSDRRDIVHVFSERQRAIRSLCVFDLSPFRCISRSSLATGLCDRPMTRRS